MNRMGIGKMTLPFLITLAVLVFLNIIGTSVLPALGLINYRLPFNILIVLYLSFRLDDPYMAVMILVTQYIHSFFTISGWEMATIAGIIVYSIVNYMRDLIHFTSIWATMAVTQIFQSVWFIIISLLLYMRVGNFSLILESFWRFIPESILVSIFSPFLFMLLDRVWTVSDDGLLGD